MKQPIFKFPQIFFTFPFTCFLISPQFSLNFSNILLYIEIFYKFSRKFLVLSKIMLFLVQQPQNLPSLRAEEGEFIVSSRKYNVQKAPNTGVNCNYQYNIFLVQFCISALVSDVTIVRCYLAEGFLLSILRQNDKFSSFSTIFSAFWVQNCEKLLWDRSSQSV